jgi:hypothetical protein
LQSKNFANFGKCVGDGQRIELVMRWISKSSINAMHSCTSYTHWFSTAGRHPGSQLKGMPLQSSFSLQDLAARFLTQGNQFSKIIDSLAVSFSPLTVWML